YSSRSSAIGFPFDLERPGGQTECGVERHGFRRRLSLEDRFDVEPDRAVDRLGLIAQAHVKLLEPRFIEEDDRLDRAAKLLALLRRPQRRPGQVGDPVSHERLLELGQLKWPGKTPDACVQEILKVAADR